MSLPWPDRIAFKLVSYIPGKVSEIIHKSAKIRQNKDFSFSQN